MLTNYLQSQAYSNVHFVTNVFKIHNGLCIIVPYITTFVYSGKIIYMVKVKNTYHCQISYASWLCLNREVYKYFVCQQAIQAQNARGRLTLKSNFCNSFTYETILAWFYTEWDRNKKTTTNATNSECCRYLVLIQVTWNTTNKNFVWRVLNNCWNNACKKQQW